MENLSRFVVVRDAFRVDLVSSVVLLAATVLTIFVFRYVLATRRMVRLLRDVPGPAPTLLLGNLGDFIQAFMKGGNEAIFNLIVELCTRYRNDGIFRIWMCWRPMVILLKPEKVEVLLSNNVALSKSFEYELFHPWLKTGLLTSTGDKWRSRRKLLTPTFHFRILEDFVPVFHQQSMIFVQKLKSVENPMVVDISPYVVLCALDIICETAMGVQINAQTTDSEYVKSLKLVCECFFSRMFKPWEWNHYLYSLTPAGWRLNKNLAKLKNFTRKVILDRKEELLHNKPTKTERKDSSVYGKKRQAFLDLLLHYMLEGQKLTEDDIQEEVDTFMFEGHDTTAVGIIWALYNIGLYPEVQRKVHEELSDIFGDDRERPITPDDLKHMKYLECVLKESQRIRPSVPLIGRGLNEDLVVDGIVVPRGSTCGISIFALHHNPEIYPDPEKFQPERFILDNPVKRHNYAYVPFSAGPRNCIGQKFAMMEEKTVVSNILRNFRLRSLDEPESIPLLPELVLRPGKEVRMEVHPK